MIKLADDTIDPNELELLSQWIKEGHKLTKGELCQEFEIKFSKFQGSKYAVFVNSGSSANLLVTQALIEGNFLKNNIAIAPAVSWVTTVTPLMQLGLDVKLCDCDNQNLGLDVEHLEELCEKYNPSVLVLVHVLGHANNLKRIKEICAKYDIHLFEDACESLGSKYKDINLGSHGLAGTFSFYYGHHISTIEGGMVVTDNEELYHLMLSIRSHGWARDLPEKIHDSWKKDYDIDEVRDLYTFYYSGFNLRSTEVNAFLGISQLNKLNEIIKVRESNYNTYKYELSEYWCQSSDTEPLSSFAYAVLVENRLETYRFLRNHEIESRPLICGNIGLHPFWIKNNSLCSLPNADIVHYQGLYLPNHYNLTSSEVKEVANAFSKIAIPFDR